MNDRTSTCESCVYWARDKGEVGTLPKSGYCGWHTLPAWAHKPNRPYDHGIPRYAQAMMADEGVDCWLHTKSGLQDPMALLTRAYEFSPLDENERSQLLQDIGSAIGRAADQTSASGSEGPK